MRNDATVIKTNPPLPLPFPPQRGASGAQRRDASRRVPGFWHRRTGEPRPGARRRFLIEKISKLTFLRGHTGAGEGRGGGEGGREGRLSRGAFEGACAVSN